MVCATSPTHSAPPGTSNRQLDPTHGRIHLSSDPGDRLGIFDYRLCQACDQVRARVERLGLLEGTSSTVTAITVIHFVAAATNNGDLVPVRLIQGIVAPIVGAFRTAHGELWLQRRSLLEKLKEVGGKLSRLDEPTDYTAKGVNMRLILADKYGKSAVPSVRRRGRRTQRTPRARSKLSRIVLAE